MNTTCEFSTAGATGFKSRFNAHMDSQHFRQLLKTRDVHLIRVERHWLREALAAYRRQVGLGCQAGFPSEQNLLVAVDRAEQGRFETCTICCTTRAVPVMQPTVRQHDGKGQFVLLKQKNNQSPLPPSDVDIARFLKTIESVRRKNKETRRLVNLLSTELERPVLTVTYEDMMNEGVNSVIERFEARAPARPRARTHARTHHASYRKILPFILRGNSAPYSVVRKAETVFVKSTPQRLCQAVRNYLEFCQVVTSRFPDTVELFSAETCVYNSRCLESRHKSQAGQPRGRPHGSRNRPSLDIQRERAAWAKKKGRNGAPSLAYHTHKHYS